MRTPFLLAVALAAALLLAGCKNPSAADVHLTCGDAYNQGATSQCSTSATSALPATAPVGHVSDAGTISMSSSITIDAVATNTGGTSETAQFIFAYNVECDGPGSVMYGHPYWVWGVDTVGVGANSNKHVAMGANCSSASPGPAAAVIYVYPGGTLSNYPDVDWYAWTPAAYSDAELDHWIVNVTLQ